MPMMDANTEALAAGGAHARTGGASAAAPTTAADTVKPVPRFPAVSQTGKHCSQQANADSGT